jgi:NADPH2:quinone reductase
MRAIVCQNWCEVNGLELDYMPEPELVAGGVRIAVCAAGINFADTLIIKGEYQVKPPLPFSPGLEVFGDILEVAPDVKKFQPGDRVMAVVHYGGYAEEVVTPATEVFLIPDSMDYTIAAGFPIAYGTSHIGIFDKLKLKAGETILINGAAGGVGLTAVEMAKK